jgi:hypothetical protein
MARCLETHVPYIFSWWGGTKSDTSDEPSSKAKITPTIDDHSALRMSNPLRLQCHHLRHIPLYKTILSHLNTFDKTETPLAAV